MNLIADSFAIATDLIAVRYNNAPSAPLAERCKTWLASVDAEEWRIRDGRFRVAQQLDMLDKAKDRVRAVLLNCK